MGEIADDITNGIELDDRPQIEVDTNGRVYLDDNGLKTCATCNVSNIKQSKAGNWYCGELCWLAKEDDKIRGQDDGEPPIIRG